MRALAWILRAFGYVWVVGFVIVVVVGTVLFVYNAPSKWEAIQAVQSDWSPFNIIGWITNLLLIAPGLLAFAISGWLQGRARSR
jgi:hypothetical protein